MLEHVAATVAAASAESGAQHWPEGSPDPEVKRRFVYGLVISSLYAYCEMAPPGRAARPAPSAN